MKIDPKVGFDKLAAFDSAKDLAAFLKAENALGYTGSEEHCPIAVWMTTHTELDYVTVSGTNICVNGEYYDTSFAMSMFINDFDDGCYPELELESFT